MAEQMFQREIPVCRVSVDGSPLAPEKHAALTRVTVDLDGDLFGQCALHFNDPRLELIDGKDFACGAAVKVELGFGSQKEQVFEGEVVSLMPQFRRDLPPFLRVVCLETYTIPSWYACAGLMKVTSGMRLTALPVSSCITVFDSVIFFCLPILRVLISCS